MLKAPPRPIAPALLSLLPPLQNVAAAGRQDVGACLLAVLVLLVPALFLQWLLTRLRKDQVRATIIVTSALLAFCYFGPLHDILDASLQGSALHRFVRLWLTMAMLGGLVACWSWWVWRTPRRLWRLLQFVNVIAVLVVAMAAATFAVRAFALHQTRSAAASEFAPTAGPRRDVFYVILDCYTSAESLRRYWGYDNSPFLAYLRSKGFHVVTNAQSNYSQTPLCILSTFNLNPVPLDLNDRQNALRLGVHKLIRDSVVVRMFEQMGYELVNLSLYHLDGVPRAYHIGPRRDGPFHSALKHTIWGRYAMARWNQEMQTYDYGTINLNLFTNLAQLPPRAPGGRPRFVYAHIMMPHVPYNFDAEGRRLTGGIVTDLTNHTAFLGQLIYTSKLVRQSLDTLLAKYPEPPIMVIQGDHGFRWLQHPEANEEGHTILNAFLLPDGGAARLPTDITPINTFRLLFNLYFGASYPMVPPPQRTRAPGAADYH